MDEVLLVEFGKVLAEYFKFNPDELPKGVDSDTLWVLCHGLQVDMGVPSNSEFDWEVRFNNADPSITYTYHIQYFYPHILSAKLVES